MGACIFPCLFFFQTTLVGNRAPLLIFWMNDPMWDDLGDMPFTLILCPLRAREFCLRSFEVSACRISLWSEMKILCTCEAVIHSCTPLVRACWKLSKTQVQGTCWAIVWDLEWWARRASLSLGSQKGVRDCKLSARRCIVFHRGVSFNIHPCTYPLLLFRMVDIPLSFVPWGWAILSLMRFFKSTVVSRI